MEKSVVDYTRIKGWGVDADPENEPTYPIKKYTGDDHERLNWVRPPQQSQTVEILHSNERPAVSAVFGTVAPPSGLSGVIRRLAFKKSESEYGHWLSLLLADRINVIEGLIDDIKRGHFPNFFSEKGWKADWKYNKKGIAKKVFVVAAISTAIILISRRKSNRGFSLKHANGLL
jgi:hypothetical protein